MRFRSMPGLLFAAAAIVLLLCGCSRGPKRVRVSGAVTFQGKPVPYGNVVFEPDRSRGNSGPQGYATIKDGHFDTGVAGGSGACQGPQVVALEGYPELGHEDPRQGRLLFNHRQTADVTGQAMTLDFDVPASAGHREARSDL